MVKAELLEPKCPTSKSQGRGYNGETSTGFQKGGLEPPGQARVNRSRLNTLREARVVHNDLKGTKRAPNPT
jgi:hypothetical protein